MARGRSPEHRGTGTCTRCGKVNYRSRHEARQARRAIHPDDRMAVYDCGTVWHFGHDNWRDMIPDDMLWRPLPEPARTQIVSMGLTLMMEAA